MNYYNENDPKAAAWLRELIQHRLIAPGEVDERSIVDVAARDLRGFKQCHFFAGIGGWSYALRLAGWRDQDPVWTMSCPCQPFSCAGKGFGEADPRHLWPFARHLIGQCRPAIVFGEQVASADGRAWLAGVSADLEALAYPTVATDLCAAGVAAPHIRQRLWWMAHAHGRISGQWRIQPRGRFLQQPRDEVAGGLADDSGQRWNGRSTLPQSSGRTLAQNGGLDGRMVNSAREQVGLSRRARFARVTDAWSSFDLIRCTDETCRRIESGTFALAHGVPGRVGLLRGYGNAIVPQLAAEFIRASVEALGDLNP